MTFGELIDGLGKNLGIELADEGGATAVEVDGIPVVLHVANDDLLLMHADLGEIAPDSRERVFAAAMEANFLYQGTGGSTLAVDSRDGHLHLQKYNWFNRLDAEKAAADIARFAETVNVWKKLVAETEAGTPAAAEDPSAPMPGGFMQV